MSGPHHHGFLDPYGRIESPVHHLPPMLKSVAAMAIVVASLAVPVPSKAAVVYFPLVGLLLVGVAGMSFVPPGFLMRRILLAEPVVLGIALLALLQPHGGQKFLSIVLRSTTCLVTMILLASTTPFSELLRVLRRLRVPAVLVTTVALMYRYLFVLVEQSQRMRRARASRTFAPERWRVWSLHANLLGQLFVRTGDRAERIYAAMCARGWDAGFGRQDERMGRQDAKSAKGNAECKMHNAE